MWILNKYKDYSLRKGVEFVKLLLWYSVNLSLLMFFLLSKKKKKKKEYMIGSKL